MRVGSEATALVLSLVSWALLAAPGGCTAESQGRRRLASNGDTRAGDWAGGDAATGSDLGQACQTNNDCQYFCLPLASGGAACSQSCTSTPDSCPPGYACSPYPPPLGNACAPTGAEDQALGEVCTQDAQCASGICPVAQSTARCSECRTTADCTGTGGECLTHPTGGYLACLSSTDLGSPCSSGTTCDSGYCGQYDLFGFDWRCSQCASDVACAGAPDGATECLADRALGYLRCRVPGELGTVCMSFLGPAHDCVEGTCALTGDLLVVATCSECDAASDCAPDQLCRFDEQLYYHVCISAYGSAALGATCQDGTACASGICGQPRFSPATCSQCDAPADCGAAQTCRYDVTAGYMRCAPGQLGDDCGAPAQCTSGACAAVPGQGYAACSACDEGADCASDMACQYDSALFYSVCQPSAPAGLGELCLDAGTDLLPLCAPDLYCVIDTFFGTGFGACSECRDGADCQAPSTCQWQIAIPPYKRCL